MAADTDHHRPPDHPTSAPLAPTSIPKPFKREPDSHSQDSLASTASSAYAAPRLLSTSSNISNSTAATDFSPTSSNAPSSQQQALERAIPPSPTHAPAQKTLPAPAPIVTSNAPGVGDTAASPMALDSPMPQGSKRTADGAVKGRRPSLDSPRASSGAHKRTKSTEVGSSSRIGELSAQLKTRLSYAMVKVQNGWEKQSLEELEERSSQRGSPSSASGRPFFESPRVAGRPRRPSGVSATSDQVMLSPAQSTLSDSARSFATTPSFWTPGSAPRISSALMPAPGLGPALAPAAEIEVPRKRRSSTAHAPPPLPGSNQRKVYSDLGTTPRTPTATPRAGILRMPSQQAEKDAVDTLLFMSSPNNSGRLPHTSADAQPSPLRAELPQRRVMFESHIGGDPTYHTSANAPPHAYFRQGPPR